MPQPHHAAKLTSPTLVLQTFQEEYFYAWQYDRPSSPYLFLFSCLLVVVVILFCLFPLAPQPIKLAVVYFSMALLIAIAVVMVVRTLLASVTWIAMGRALWLFPHLLSDVSFFPPPCSILSDVWRSQLSCFVWAKSSML